MKEKLEARKKAVEKEQAELQQGFDELKKKGAEINRQLDALQKRFNGNLRVLNEIEEFIKEEPKPSEKPKKPSKPLQ